MSTNGLMTRSGIMLDDHDSGREVIENIGLQLDHSRKSMPDKSRYRPAVLKQFQGRPSCNRPAKYDFEKVNETIYWNSGALLKTLETRR